jgi:hypothetical protein
MHWLVWGSFVKVTVAVFKVIVFTYVCVFSLSTSASVFKKFFGTLGAISFSEFLFLMAVF